jgi:hypothetical protein
MFLPLLSENPLFKSGSDSAFERKEKIFFYSWPHVKRYVTKYKKKYMGLSILKMTELGIIDREPNSRLPCIFTQCTRNVISCRILDHLKKKKFPHYKWKTAS